MSFLNLDDAGFWRAKESLFANAARRTRNADPTEAHAYVWQRLQRRYGDVSEVDEEELNRYIFNSSRRYWNLQHNRKIQERRKFEKFALDLKQRIALIRNGRRLSTTPNNQSASVHIDPRDVGRLLTRLDPAVRDLVQKRFGIDTDALPVREIAIQRRVSPQSVNRRLSRSFEFLKHSFPNSN